MAYPFNSKFLTCRYWAFGPRCPNIDQAGIDVCEYAHYDTGVLASSFQQRGTCAWWVRHACAHGNDCYYEHRHTGVPGLYQGVILLTGLNLEIADAAASSGFNTLNHEALMKLIWSVKRVLLKSKGPHGAVPPPKDPIYPDRYRPSGRGDNTHRKRHLPATNSPPPFYPVRPLIAKKNITKKNKKTKKKTKHEETNRLPNINTDALNRVLGNPRVTKVNYKPKNANNSRKEGTTMANPINLLSDSEDEPGRQGTAANISAKRQKTSTDLRGSFRAVEEQVATRTRNTSKVLPINTFNSFTKNQCLNLLDNTPGDRANTDLEIVAIMNAVKGSLQTVRKTMVDCRLTMKSLYNKNDTRLSNDHIFSIMSALAGGIDRASDGARDATVEIDRAVKWLDSRDGVKEEGS